jgi:hypothetical protein
MLCLVSFGFKPWREPPRNGKLILDIWLPTSLYKNEEVDAIVAFTWEDRSLLH